MTKDTRGPRQAPPRPSAHPADTGSGRGTDRPGPGTGSRAVPASAPIHHDGQDPPAADLRTLGIATAAAAVVAMLVLAVAILPAEYGVDPTGLGTAMGLTGLASDAPRGPEVVTSATDQDDGYTTHNVTLTVPAGGDVEYKLHVAQGDGFVYAWHADGVLTYDLHGEPDGGAPGAFTSHKASRGPDDDGVLEVDFTGDHGWYFRNDGDRATTVTLHASGFFEVVGIV